VGVHLLQPVLVKEDAKRVEKAKIPVLIRRCGDHVRGYIESVVCHKEFLMGIPVEKAAISSWYFLITKSL
jgi:hypothetical protein